MVYEELIYKKVEDGIVLVTLNRPHRLNAISEKLQTEIHDIIDQVESDDDVKVLVINSEHCVN